MDLGGLEEGLVLSLDLAANDVLADIILLFVEGESLGNLAGAFEEESVGDFAVSAAGDLLLALLDDDELEDRNVGANDAAADGAADAFTGATREVVRAG